MRRFRSLASAFLLSCISLNSLPAEDLSGSVKPAPEQHLIDNSFADWKLNVRLNHSDGVYAIGERMDIEVASPRECYVHIINVNPEGRFEVLWPMDARTSNRVTEGQTVKFPDRGNHPKYVFEAAAPVGKELIVCLATTTPLNLKDPAHADLIERFLSQLRGISPHPLTTLRSIVTRVEQDQTGWTATAFELQTVENRRSNSAAVVPPAVAPSTGTAPALPQPVADPDTSAVATTAPDAPAPIPATPTVTAPSPASGAELTTPMDGQSEGPARVGVFTAPRGVGEIVFPGPFEEQPATTSQHGELQVRTTVATLKLEGGVLLFSESQLNSNSAISNAILAEAALVGGTDFLKQQFGIADSQIAGITAGHLQGREYRGPGLNGCFVWLRLYVDPATNSSITIACIGDQTFPDSEVARNYMNSFRVLRQ